MSPDESRNSGIIGTPSWSCTNQSLGRLSGAILAYHVVDKLMMVPNSVVSLFEFSGRSRMDGGLEKKSLL
jgi:hypothetical protein